MLVGVCLCMGGGVDPYLGFRDERGRFIDGNPGSRGRSKGSYVWLSAEEFKDGYPFLSVVVPGACLDCGGVVYRFNVRFDDRNTYVIRCKCNRCNRPRIYNPYVDSWGSI